MTTPLPRQRGPAADEITELWWVFLAMGAAVYALVLVILLLPMLRRWRARRTAAGDGSAAVGAGGEFGDVPPRLASLFIVGLGVVLPLVVLIVALALSVSTMQAVSGSPARGSVVIDVVGAQFWWKAHYPVEGVTVANEIHVPVGEPVELRLTSTDVIHSFWVPDLHGKLDALPDGTNTLVIEADEAGVYGGECAEFCGLQHANMGLLVIAEPRADFERWMTAQQAAAAPPVDAAARRGQELFVDAGCGACHTVRGVVEGDGSGPDLTHVASRATLLSDTIDNTSAGLTALLRDPEAVKVGIAMPAPALSEEELRDLVAFLDGLS